MSTKAALPPRMEQASLPAKVSLPKQPTDGANWHDWLTLGVFALSTCLLLMGVAAILTVLSKLDSQGNEINTLRTSLEQLSNPQSPPLAETLKQQHKQSMNGLNMLDQRLKDFQPTADPRLDQLAELQTQIHDVKDQLAEIEKAIKNLPPPAPQQTDAPAPANGPARTEVFPPTPELPQPQPVF